MVLNQTDNAIDLEFIEQMNAVLDKIESSKGAACLVTIARGNKKFSVGYDQAYWNKDKMNVIVSLVEIQLVFARIMTLPMATLCCISGHAYSSGLNLAMVHDYRFMRHDFGRLSLAELSNINYTFPSSYQVLLQETMTT
mmetsp:Transcript_8122/g.5794  ORF Transcript_8122/g.5794 Transcript_8122/m.5794 type:complete len:139 (+) Transcript_8122:80-496(+)|eukprot:CAMPEP_0116881364 /NCGR_PEP_ID=MMETSP0463-20121206/13484_1 /TAXON_ID=181622 /ORGANISM="Strombidinopsis sp, Strain SopsisLIS2011" /LENGTH=138 /DNA_ID=CAMNT_0004533251 /DNA_START=80 /DNA_END=496 /DNA_ORIENTATION=-